MLREGMRRISLLFGKGKMLNEGIDVAVSLAGKAKQLKMT